MNNVDKQPILIPGHHILTFRYAPFAFSRQARYPLASVPYVLSLALSISEASLTLMHKVYVSLVQSGKKYWFGTKPMWLAVGKDLCHLVSPQDLIGYVW